MQTIGLLRLVVALVALASQDISASHSLSIYIMGLVSA